MSIAVVKPEANHCRPTMAPAARRTGGWSPASWQRKPAQQQVQYPDPRALKDVLKSLAALPPLVSSWEVESLKQLLAEVAAGKRFLLQGGDCAEEFQDCESSVIARKLKILLQMSLALAYGSGKPVVNVARIAGQYAKPRSCDTETQDGITLPSYRGCNVNRPAFTEQARTPEPELLLRGYEHAAMSLNFIRSLVDGGFADLHHPEYWNIDFFDGSSQSLQYLKIVESIRSAIHFMESITGSAIDELNRVRFFTSHEALHLPFEQARTRQVPRRSLWYNLSAHFLWIGDRTRALDGAHVEYIRGIANPIGVKVGPTTTPLELVQLVNTLNPENEPGRLTLIHRLGVNRIADHLPPLIEAVQGTGAAVLWCCDPMHGNTVKTASGVKTRKFDDILDELKQAFVIHNRVGSLLNGVHFELTGEDVTECIGGARKLNAADLSRAYKSRVDPRLNYEQSLEMALRVARLMRQQSKPNGRRQLL